MKTTEKLPVVNISPFKEYIGKLQNQRIFFEPLRGNNGDHLIKMGMLRILEGNNIELCPEPKNADIVLLNGGGAMNDIWPEGAAQVIEKLILNYPDKKFVVGPSSYHFTQINFSRILGMANCGVVLFCREQSSYESLKKLDMPSNVQLFLSQDLAFELEGSKFIQRQTEASVEKTVLCALRKDREGKAGVLAKVNAPWLPNIVRLPLSKIRDRLVARKSSEKISEILLGSEIDATSREIIYRDVSISVPFEEFCKEIRRAELIVTDRLHVAIFGSLIKKKVHLLPGIYHKNSAVFDFSLKKRGNIQLH